MQVSDRFGLWDAGHKVKKEGATSLCMNEGKRFMHVSLKFWLVDKWFSLAIDVGRVEEKSSSGKKFELPKKSNFFPLELFPPNIFWFIWKQRCYSNGRPLILKLVSNYEEWNDKNSMIQLKLKKKIYLKV